MYNVYNRHCVWNIQCFQILLSLALMLVRSVRFFVIFVCYVSRLSAHLFEPLLYICRYRLFFAYLFVHTLTHIWCHITSRETDSTTLYTEFENELTFPPHTYFFHSFWYVYHLVENNSKRNIFISISGFSQTFYYVECKINLTPAPTRSHCVSSVVVPCSAERLISDCHCRNSWPCVQPYVCVLYEKWKSRMVVICLFGG